jgi:LysR family glycine cleavage system transcriptional activator
MMPLSPPRPPQAPLTALRAFEAAGRHGSFTRAAEELSITPGAVAQQIRKLEDWAGGRLFERHAQGVTLTALGARILPDLTRGFDTLGQATRMLRRKAGIASVRIAALPAIAQLWLSPRLTALRAALPEVELSIHALDICPPLARGEVDLAIYPGGPEHGRVTVLSENHLIPVAAPQVAETIATPDDLARAPLIHDLAWKQDWSTWLGANGIQAIEAERGPTHSLYSIAVERCVAGDGILIGHSALIGRQLAEGSLRALFPDLAVPALPICLTTAAADDGDGLPASVVAAITTAA